MHELKLKIAGMSCVNCQKNIEKSVLALAGVSDASVSFLSGTGLFLCENEDTKARVKACIKDLGFSILASESELLRFKQKELRMLKIKLILAFILTIVLFCFEHFSHAYSDAYIELFLCFISVFILGFSFHKKAILGLKNKLLDMNTLISLGSSLSFFYSCLYFFISTPMYFLGASMIITFVLFGKNLEERARLKASLYLAKTKEDEGSFCTIIKDGSEQKIRTGFIRENDLIKLVKGDVLKVDAIIEKGEGNFDFSVISGESKNVFKKAGDTLLAGAILQDNTILARATSKGAESSILCLDDIIYQAMNKKIKLSFLVDKISGYFVAIILLLALGTFIYYFATAGVQTAFLRALSVLLVSCPCALGMAVPLALSIALKQALLKDILIKDPLAIERLNSLKSFYFDKTGTLTASLKLTSTNLSNKHFAMLCAMQKECNHQISTAILRYYSGPLSVQNKVYYEKNGIKCFIEDDVYYCGNKAYLQANAINIRQEDASFKGQSLIYFANSRTSLGVIALSPKLQKGAKELINYLKSKQKSVGILSGDDEASVKMMAKELGVNDYHFALLPEEKEKIVKNSPCVFVGDGVNDALSLLNAELGIVIENASFISKKAGDILLLRKDLSSIIYLLRLGEKTFSIIKLNLIASFVYNACLIPIAMGLTPLFIAPSFAAFAMCLSSLSVMLNSLRLRGFK